MGFADSRLTILFLFSDHVICTVKTVSIYLEVPVRPVYTEE